MATKTKAQREQDAQDMEHALSVLREELPPGSMVHTVLLHVSSSGMSRVIMPVIVTTMTDRHGVRGPVPWNVSRYVARVLGERFDDRRGGVWVNGGGMDMGFHLVYSLSRCLYPHGFDCPGERCPSNDHVNSPRAPYATADAPVRHERDGGYALSHRWM